jgi:hypothetical protein
MKLLQGLYRLRKSARLYAVLFARPTLAKSISIVFPQKAVTVELVKKFTALYGARRHITVFTRANHCILTRNR